MVVKRFAILVVFVALVFPRASADIAVTVGSRQAALVVQDTRFEPAVQLLTETGIGTQIHRAFESGAAIAFDGGIAIGRISPSAPFGGYFYRGLSLRGAALSGEFVAAGGAGVRVSTRAVWGSYELTTLLFFYPEIELAPTFRMRLGDRLRVDWALPVFYQFRQDLAYAFGLGLSGRLSLEFQTPESVQSAQ